jgi:hypothetical protein
MRAARAGHLQVVNVLVGAGVDKDKYNKVRDFLLLS